jgi:hypothetical protein
MFKNHIERLKSGISEMEVNSQARDARLKASEDRLEEQQRINNSNALLIQTLQTQQAMNDLLIQTAQAAKLLMIEEREEARNAFELEVAYLRDNNDALGLESTALKQERSARKKKESNAKRSVLRSFDWREDKVVASVLRFWVSLARNLIDCIRILRPAYILPPTPPSLVMSVISKSVTISCVVM